MNWQLAKNLLLMIGTVIVGAFILVILTVAIGFVVATVLFTTNPPPPICPEIHDDTVPSLSEQPDCVEGANAFHNIQEAVLIFFISYGSSILIVSFFSGYFLQRVRGFIWQSFANGFIIGFIGPALLTIAGSKIRPQDVIVSFILAGISGSLGLLGYAFAHWRKRASNR